MRIPVYCVLLLLFTVSASSEVKRIASNSDLRTVVSMASPGDTILLPEGTMDFGGGLTITRSGTPEHPILITAQRQGVTRLIGRSRFLLLGVEHVSISGLDFSTTEGPGVEMRGCAYVRITRNVFHIDDSKRSNWVMITGNNDDTLQLSHDNRIDHNLFENKKVIGNFITIEGTKTSSPQSSQHDRIDHNHFRDIGPRIENGLEAIRAGSSEFSLSGGYTVIEENLFERCDGDPEYISIKSSNDTIRYNTFRECLGSLSLRHGNGTVVEGNFILGNGRTGLFHDSTGKIWTLGTGGVRFYGDNMVILNNYFEGLTGSLWDGSLVVSNGDAEYGDGQSLTKHFRIRDALIAFNTFVNNKSNIEIGYDGGGFQNNWWKLPPTGVLFANNIVVGSSDTLVKILTPPVNSEWTGNIMFAKRRAEVSSSRVDGIQVIDPLLVNDGTVWRLEEMSPAIDRAAGLYPRVIEDMDGQPRGDRKDIGADEFSHSPVTRHPLTARDVGPDADIDHK